MRCFIVLSLVAFTAGLKVQNGVSVNRKAPESFAETEKTMTLSDMQTAYATARDRLEQMHFSDAQNIKINEKVENSYLVKKTKEDLESALSALAPELKKGQSVRQWFQEKGFEGEYANIKKLASSIPLDAETEQLAKEVRTNFANILMETGGSEKSEEEMKSIIQKHTAGTQEKMKKFAATHPPIDMSLIAMNLGSKASIPPYNIPARNTNFDKFHCTVQGHAMELNAQNACIFTWATPPQKQMMGATTNAAICIDSAADFWDKLCEMWGVGTSTLYKDRAQAEKEAAKEVLDDPMDKPDASMLG